MRPAHILMACMTSTLLYSSAPAAALAGPSQGSGVPGGTFCTQEAQEEGFLGFLAPLLCGPATMAPESQPEPRGWSIEHRGWSIEHTRINPTPADYQGWSIEHRGWSIEHRGWSIEHAQWGE